MKSRALTWTSLTVGSGLLLLGTLKLAESSRADDAVEPIPAHSDSAPAPSIKPYMQAKLVHAENVLQGLVLQDFDRITRGAEGLRNTSLSTPGPHGADRLNDEVYQHFRLEFLRLSTRLAELAEAKNLEGTAFTYNNLTANCMACHHYLRQNSSGNAARSPAE
jgi:hypothetical protein